jgi:O-antigen ligase
VAVLLLVRPRLAAALAAWLWGAAAVVLALALRAFPAALHLDRGAGAQASDGLPVALLCAGLAVAVGVAFALVMRRREVAAGPAGAPAFARSHGWLAAAAVAAVLGAGLAVSFATERTEDISKSAARVTTLKTYRGEYWRVALRSFADHPVAGVGTAGFQVEWIREREERVFAFDAHSLYIETLAELGIVGFALLAAFAACVAGGLRRRFRAAPGDPLLAAGAAVLGAFAVHAGLDWDWEMPAVTLPALLLAAACVQRPAPDE